MTELLKLIADSIYLADVAACDCDSTTCEHQAMKDAENVLGAIEASGRVTVDRARFERLLRVAESAYEYTNAPYPSGERDSAESRQTKAVDALQQGDLEPLP